MSFAQANHPKSAARFVVRRTTGLISHIGTGAMISLLMASICVFAPAAWAVGASSPTGGAAAASGDAERVPAATKGVGVAEKLGERVPLDLTVRDEHGDEHPLRAFFDGDKPVILNLGYYGCPMLCGLVMNALADGVVDMGWTPGDQFTIVTLSIDPNESHRLALEKKRNYINQIGMADAAAGWHFLTADKETSEAVAEAVGFKYRYDPIQSQYAHSAVLVILMPDGRVSRYLYGITFPGQTLRLSLVEASEGKVGSTIDHVLLTCFRYDPAAGGYRFAAIGLMRVAGAATVVVVAGLIGGALLRERRQRRVAVTS